VALPAPGSTCIVRLRPNSSGNPGPPHPKETPIFTNAEINAKGESAAEFKGMGTTCTVLVVLPRGALVGHIGDSRAYRIRSGKIEQLSRDHSLVWELESGGLTREQAAGAAPKNIITRSMGPHAHVEVDLEGPFPVEDGDIFLLCSDGLSGQVADEVVFDVCLQAEELRAVPAELAVRNGGHARIDLERLEEIRVVVLGLCDRHAVGGIGDQRRAVIAGLHRRVSRAGARRQPDLPAGEFAEVHRRPQFGQPGRLGIRRLRDGLHEHDARMRLAKLVPRFAAHTAGHLRERREIRDVAERVADALAEHRLGARVDQALELRGVRVVGEAHIEKTVPGRFGIDTFGVGMDTGSPVSNTYKPPFAFTGTIHEVRVELK
jgi:hypothetical protein